MDNLGEQTDAEEGASLADLVDQITERMLRGERVDARDYAAEHPQHTESLRAILPTIGVLTAGLAAAEETEEPRDDSHASGAERVATSPRVLGDYRIVAELGRGGMGVVFEAEQISLKRRVALKILPFAAVLDRRHLQRFEIESKAAASLDHPSIVRIYGVGCERGVHFYAMQLIDGQTLGRVIEHFRLPRDARTAAPVSASGGDPAMSAPTAPWHAVAADQGDTSRSEETRTGDATVWGSVRYATPEFFRWVAELGIQAAEALEHAHQIGVVHRDVKPSNLMLDGRGHLWVTDFGLAMTLADPGVTMTGDVVGTLRYMSPEQAGGRRFAVDHHTDIYSWGATLYELLTLQPAFGSADHPRLVRQVAEEEPTPLRRLNPLIPDDLETIVLKAMAKEPSHRYATAQDIADDLRRFLAHQPIRARRATLNYRIAKVFRRNVGIAITLLASALMTALVLAVSLFFVGDARQHAIEQRNVAQDQRQRAEEQAELLRGQVYAADIRLARDAWQQGNVSWAVEHLEKYLPQRGGTDIRGFEWHYLWGLCHPVERSLRGHTDVVYGVAFHPQGKYLASTSEDGTIRIWDVAARQTIRILHVQPHSDAVVFSPDGTQMAAAENEQVKLWSTDTFQETALFRGHEGEVLAIAFSPSGTLVASGGIDGQVRVWDLTTGNCRLIETAEGTIKSVAFSPDGTLLARGGTDEVVKIWEVTTGRLKSEHGAHDNDVTWLAFSPDGSVLASCSSDRTIVIWDVVAAAPRATLLGHTDRIDGLAMSPDGTLLAAAGKEGTVRVYDWQSGEMTNVFCGHVGRVGTVDFSPDGRTIASGGWDAAVILWDALRPQEVQTLDFPAKALKFTDGSTLWASGPRGVASWDVRQWSQQSWIAEPEVSNIHAAFDPDCRIVARCAPGGPIYLWDVREGKLLQTIGVGDNCRHPLAFSPDGRTVVSSKVGGEEFYVWDVASGHRVHSVSLPTSLHAMGFAPDGLSLALACGDFVIRRWDTKTWSELPGLEGHGDTPFALTFIPVTGILATAANDRTVRFWDTQSGDQIARLVGHRDNVEAIAGSPDGKTLASFGADGSLRVWHTASHQEMLRFDLPPPSGDLRLAFSTDNRVLASASTEGIYLFLSPAVDAAADRDAR